MQGRRQEPLSSTEEIAGKMLLRNADKSEGNNDTPTTLLFVALGFR